MKFDIKQRSINSIKYIMTLGLITRVLAQFQILLKGSIFGLNLETYDLAFGNIALITGLLSSTLIYSLVPIFRSIQNEFDTERVFRTMNNIINTSIIFLLVCFIIFALVFLNNFNADRKLLILGLPMILAVTIRTTLISFLVMRHGFLAGARGGISRAMVYIIYLLIFGDRYGVEGIMVVGTLANISQIIIAYGICNNNHFKYKFIIDLKDRFLADFFRNTLFIMLPVYIYGLIPKSKYNHKLFNYYIGWFLGAVMSVIYPILVEEYHVLSTTEGASYKDYNRILSGIFGFLIKATIPILIILFVSSNIIKDLFIHGDNNLPNLSIYFGFGLIAMILLPLIFRVFLSQKDYLGLMMSVGTMYIIAIILDKIDIQWIQTYNQDIVLFTGLIISYILIRTRCNFKLHNSVLNKLGIHIKSGAIMLITLFIMNYIYGNFIAHLFMDGLIPFISMIIVGFSIYIVSIYNLEKQILFL